MNGHILCVGVWLGWSCLWASAIQSSIPHLLDPCERPSRPGGPPLPLHCAAARGDLDEAQRHLDAGLPVNAVDRQYRTPLHWAVQYGRDAMIAFLIEQGADPNAADRDGNPPLFYTRRPDIIGCLLERGAAVDAQNHLGHTLLHLSVHYPTAVERLLAADAAMDAPNAAGLTPLDIAGMAGQSAVVVRMIRSGGAVTEALHLAAFNGQVDVVRTYIENGADVHLRDAEGNSLLHKALMPRTASLDVVRYLLEQGADAMACNDAQQTPLHLAVRGSRPYPFREISALLVAAGAEINAEDRSGLTPFFLALSRGGHYHRPDPPYPSLIRFLLDHGAALDHLHRDGRTPLHFAAGQRANHDILDMLIEAGCAVEARDGQDRTPLHLAAAARRLETANWLREPINAEALLARGADVHARDRNGRTPLHVAAGAGRLQTVSLLLRHGADPRSQDEAGRTPLDLARAHNRTEVIEWLETR